MDHSVMSALRHSARISVVICLALFRGHTLQYARYGTYAAARLDTPPKVEVFYQRQKLMTTKQNHGVVVACIVACGSNRRER